MQNQIKNNYLNCCNATQYLSLSLGPHICEGDWLSDVGSFCWWIVSVLDRLPVSISETQCCKLDFDEGEFLYFINNEVNYNAAVFM